jgi:hypothetical protein
LQIAFRLIGLCEQKEADFLANTDLINKGEQFQWKRRRANLITMAIYFIFEIGSPLAATTFVEKYNLDDIAECLSDDAA